MSIISLFTELAYNQSMIDIHPLLTKIGQYLAQDSRVWLAYLFGSQVSGRIGPMSDIDLGILFAEEVEFQLASAELAHEVSKVIPGEPVDIVVLNTAPVELAYAVIAQGTCLFRKNEVIRIEYEADVLSRHGDFLPVLRAMRKDIIVGGGHERRVQRYRAALGRTERTLGKIRASAK